jgi:hypothetical protein
MSSKVKGTDSDMKSMSYDRTSACNLEELARQRWDVVVGSRGLNTNTCKQHHQPSTGSSHCGGRRRTLTFAGYALL